MKIMLSAFGLVFCAGSALADTDCKSPLVYASRDLDQQEVEEGFVSYAYNNICSWKSAKAGFDFISSSSTLIDAVPLKSAMSFGGRKEKAEQFCKEQSEFADMHRAASKSTSIVVRESLQAFNIVTPWNLLGSG